MHKLPVYNCLNFHEVSTPGHQHPALEAGSFQDLGRRGNHLPAVLSPPARVLSLLTSVATR